MLMSWAVEALMATVPAAKGLEESEEEEELAIGWEVGGSGSEE